MRGTTARAGGTRPSFANRLGARAVEGEGQPCPEARRARGLGGEVQKAAASRAAGAGEEGSERARSPVRVAGRTAPPGRPLLPPAASVQAAGETSQPAALPPFALTKPQAAEMFNPAASCRAQQRRRGAVGRRLTRLSRPSWRGVPGAGEPGHPSLAGARLVRARDRGPDRRVVS